MSENSVEKFLAGVLSMPDQLKAKDARIAELTATLEGMLAITQDSTGVAGYHLNGNVAEWDEFEEVAQALAALAAVGEKK